MKNTKINFLSISIAVLTLMITNSAFSGKYQTVEDILSNAATRVAHSSQESPLQKQEVGLSAFYTQPISLSWSADLKSEIKMNLSVGPIISEKPNPHIHFVLPWKMIFYDDMIPIPSMGLTLNHQSLWAPSDRVNIDDLILTNREEIHKDGPQESVYGEDTKENYRKIQGVIPNRPEESPSEIIVPSTGEETIPSGEESVLVEPIDSGSYPEPQSFEEFTQEKERLMSILEELMGRYTYEDFLIVTDYVTQLIFNSTDVDYRDIKVDFLSMLHQEDMQRIAFDIMRIADRIKQLTVQYNKEHEEHQVEKNLLSQTPPFTGALDIGGDLISDSDPTTFKTITYMGREKRDLHDLNHIGFFNCNHSA